jgi:hypothetical protein
MGKGLQKTSDWNSDWRLPRDADGMRVDVHIYTWMGWAREAAVVGVTWQIAQHESEIT